MTEKKNKYSQLDKEAPIPYVRKDEVKKYKTEEVKYHYETEEVTTKVSEVTDAEGKRSTVTERTTVPKLKKKLLKCYGHSAEEDAESFFIAFERFRTELDVEWRATSASKQTNAQILFDGFDKIETINDEQHAQEILDSRYDAVDFQKLVKEQRHLWLGGDYSNHNQEERIHHPSL